MKLAIIGSRNFTKVELLERELTILISFEGYPTEVISGGAAGADVLAENWAERNGIAKRIFKPDFEAFPKSEKNWAAPKARNLEIAKSCDVLIAFWNMRSTGTRDTIEKALSRGKKVYICNVLLESTMIIESITQLDSI